MPVSGPAVIHYKELRRTIGLLGLCFPIIVALGGKLFFDLALKPSLSQYYYSDMRDVFVGLLFAIGVFLSAYRGYGPSDKYLGPAAGLSAVGIALFPMPFKNPLPCPCLPPWASYAHYVFALLFFSLLIYYCLHEFVQNRGSFTVQKRTRNRIYQACGWIMIACVVGMALVFLLEKLGSEPAWLAAAEPIFWGEAIAICAFGFSWLVKGETVFRDR